MNESILGIVEESLLNIAKRYKEFSNNPDVAESDLKGFDEQLNDIMDRYNKLKGLQSTYTAEELTIKLNEFQILYDDLVLKISNGFFKGADGINGVDGQNGSNGLDGKDFTYNDFTPEQLALLKGADGINGVDGQNGSNGLDGKDFTYNDFTPEQLALLKGADGINGVDGQNGLNGTNGLDGKDFTYNDFTPEQLALLKGADGINGADGQNGLDGTVTFESLTPEQIASLKGADGINGVDGLNGTNGIDGKDFTYDMFTPEQITSLKGAKGDNGLDGQNLTYADLTIEQKQEFANLVPSGGNSDLTLNVVSAFGSLATESLHVKTGLKADALGFIVGRGYMFYSATAKYVLSNTCIYQTVLKPDGSVIVGTALSTTHFSGSYISSDGYLCIICKSSNYSILYDLDIFDYTNNKKCSVLGSFVTADALYYQTH